MWLRFICRIRKLLLSRPELQKKRKINKKKNIEQKRNIVRQRKIQTNWQKIIHNFAYSFKVLNKLTKHIFSNISVSPFCTVKVVTLIEKNILNLTNVRKTNVIINYNEYWFVNDRRTQGLFLNGLQAINI